MSQSDKEYKRRYRAEHPDYRDRERRQRAVYRAAKNAAWRDELHRMLAERGCADCGGVAVDFHHVDPATRFKNVSDMGEYSPAMRAAEMAKCVPLCASCHAKRHRRQKNFRGVTRWNKDHVDITAVF